MLTPTPTSPACRWPGAAPGRAKVEVGLGERPCGFVSGPQGRPGFSPGSRDCSGRPQFPHSLHTWDDGGGSAKPHGPGRICRGKRRGKARVGWLSATALRTVLLPTFMLGLQMPFPGGCSVSGSHNIRPDSSPHPFFSPKIYFYLFFR